KFLRQPEWTGTHSTLAIFIVPLRPSRAGQAASAPLDRVYSNRPIALDRHTPAGPRLRVIVPERLMLDAAIVPERDRMGLPAEPHLDLLARAELAQKGQDRAALLPRQPVDMRGELAVDVERLAPGHRVGANDRMRCLRVGLAALGDAHQR